jgi:transcriptional regulator with XRE-family HTH domain
MFLKKREDTIKGALMFHKMTQKKLAKELEMSESYITRLVNGTRYSRKFEEYISRVFGIDYRKFY